jgi:hypothetical protein
MLVGVLRLEHGVAAAGEPKEAVGTRSQATQVQPRSPPGSEPGGDRAWIASAYSSKARVAGEFPEYRENNSEFLRFSTDFGLPGARRGQIAKQSQRLGTVSGFPVPMKNRESWTQNRELGLARDRGEWRFLSTSTAYAASFTRRLT